MWLEIRAKRKAESKAKGPKAILDLTWDSTTESSVHCNIAGSNEEIIEEEYRDRVLDPGVRGGSMPASTEYAGSVSFDHHEIVWLFREVVEASAKSDEFKRICLAMVDEFSRKPPKKRWRSARAG